MDVVETSPVRSLCLNLALWITVAGALCAITAGAMTAVGGMETIVRPVAFAAMVCAIVAIAGAVLHTVATPKTVFAILGVAMLIAGSTFFGLTFPQS